MPGELPKNFRSDFVDCGDVRLHVVHNGEPYYGTPFVSDRPPLVLLHGFPEFWLAWQGVMQQLGDRYHILVPDQRGYNLSDAPEGAEFYQAKLLVQDITSLTAKILGDRPFTLGGHDWGASIAYALAIGFPEMVKGLFIANGVHPACFQQALIDNYEQAKASSYFHVLRAKGAGKIMAEDDFRRTFAMFEKFSLTPWLTAELKGKYRKAWSDEKRLNAMLNWYNSSPIIVPEDGQIVKEAPLYNVSADAFRIPMPHRLLWGMGDQALLPQSRLRLPEFCDDLVVCEIVEADHWILHTHADEAASMIIDLIET